MTGPGAGLRPRIHGVGLAVQSLEHPEGYPLPSPRSPTSA
jgi:hypothetical protein